MYVNATRSSCTAPVKSHGTPKVAIRDAQILQSIYRRPGVHTQQLSSSSSQAVDPHCSRSGFALAEAVRAMARCRSSSCRRSHSSIACARYTFSSSWRRIQDGGALPEGVELTQRWGLRRRKAGGVGRSVTSKRRAVMWGITKSLCREVEKRRSWSECLGTEPFCQQLGNVDLEVQLHDKKNL
jgi:hypothetical protein